MYHYVRPSNAELPYFSHLHIEDFTKQLDYFEKRYGFLSKDDFLLSLKTGVPGDGVVLTFDDGFKDHYKYVLPYLRKRDLWGIFYVPTGIYHSGKLLDVHRIHMLLGKYGGYKILNSLKNIVSEDMLSHKHVEEFKIQTYNKQNNDDYTNIVKRILNYFISYKYRKVVIDKLMCIFLSDERDISNLFYMSSEEICQMQTSGMIIGSHTVNHLVMSKLKKEEQEKEIIDSFNFLDKITGGLTFKTFCYPYGGFHSFTKDTEDLLEKNDCLFSFNVEPKDIDSFHLKNRLQAMPRYDCSDFPHGLVRV